MESSTTRQQQRPPPLPRGWSKWGKDAVYFASSTYSCKGTDGEAISIYAINTKDELFPVYHVKDFPCGPDICKASEAACAVLDDRVYVVAGRSMWFRDLHLWMADWEEGFILNGFMTNPKLFTLKGYLYALDSVLRYESPAYSFQVHVNPGWLTLDDPPTLFPTDADCESVHDCVIRGLSCIDDDSKVILHVSTAQQGPNPPCELCFKQHFLCFRITDECDGEWSTLEIKLPDSCVPRASQFPDDLYPFYRSHLNGGEPLILPSLPDKLHALYLVVSSSEPPELRLEYDQEVDTSYHDLDCEWRKKTMLIWNLFHVAGTTKYCAIAFPHPKPNDYRDSFHGGFFVFSFNLAAAAVLPDEEEEEMDIDGYNASASSRKLTIEHVHKWSGVQCPFP